MGIEIKEPCSEDWRKMTPTQKGAFCKACAKEVVDFTGMSSLEIKTQLAIHYSSSKNICGRIETAQLAEINGEFYQWKSERERFNTVWIFSLIAIFGLTLFSCQNTLTKEIVSQMETNGAQMIESESSEFELLTVDDELEVVSQETEEGISEEEKLDTLESSNLENDYPMRWVNITECTVTMGWMNYPNILSGVISVDEPSTKDIFKEAVFPKFLEAYLPDPIFPNPPKLEMNPNPIVQQSNQNVILNVEEEDFEIAIHPLPIDASSRLLIDAKMAIRAEISLTHLEEGKTTYSGKKHFQTGKHSIDLKLSELLSGNYILKVSSSLTEKSLEFSI